MDVYIADMVQAVETVKPTLQRSELLHRFGQELLTRPDNCAMLIREAGRGQLSDGQMAVLTAALDEARMADENGQRKGRAFLDAMRDAVAGLDTALTSGAALSLSSSWVRAGLTPPPTLAHAITPEGPNAFADTGALPDLSDEMFDEIFQRFTEIGKQSVSALLELLDELLPTLPSGTRSVFIRKLAAQAEPLCGEAAVALLLSTDASVREGARAGLALRQKAGNLSQNLFFRMTLIRSWIQDPDTLHGLDGIIRAALKSGTKAPGQSAKPKIHRVVSCMVDGNGTQSISMAIQSGSRRTLAMVLLKQGFGVKEAFTIPCTSATEQKQMITGIAGQAQAFEVTPDYAFTALGWALADGQSNGIMPAAGLLDVLETAGFAELRPQTADIADIAAAADPEGAVSALSVRASGSLIMASEHWPDRFPVSGSWFEDSDAALDAIESATTCNSMTRRLWQYLETRRDFWAMIFARNAALLMAARDSAGPEFVAVAQAILESRPLKKTPIMQFVHDMSLTAWIHQDASPLWADGDGLTVTEKHLPSASYAQVAPFGAKERKALERLLRPARITLPWVEGFLTGLCTAPRFISPATWIVTMLNILTEDMDLNDDLQKVLDMVVLAYNHHLSLLRGQTPSRALFPADPISFSSWANGYLTAWDAHKPYWPAPPMGENGKTMRTLLEQAAKGHLKTGKEDALRSWLIAGAKRQK